MYRLYISLLLVNCCFPAIAQTRDIKDDTTKNIQLKNVIISAERINHRNTVGEIIIDKDVLKTNHGLIEDPLRVISTMPGVARGGDLFAPSQIYVRGGAPEENLFLNNNTKLYFPFYFGGQKSIFNSDVIEDVELLTGGFPAKYGNVLSSVLNVTTRDGNPDKYTGLGSVGFYNASLLLEGPVTNNSSFIVAARKTYLDFFMKSSSEFPVPIFGDITFKYSWRPAKHHKITLSGLSGYEKLDYIAADPQPGIPDRLQTSGNSHNQSLQWQYNNSKLYSKLSLVNTVQQSDAIISRNINLDLKGRETGLREDLEYNLSKKLKLQTGLEIYNSGIDFNSTLPLDPREADPTDSSVTLTKTAFNKISWIGGSWLASEVKLGKKMGFNVGLRHDFINSNSLHRMAPRISAYYTLLPKTELRVAHSYHYQFPSSEAMDGGSIETPLCIHYITGVRQQFKNGYSGWVEFYYKDYQNLVTFDTLLRYGNNGTGHSKGLELFFAKTKGSLTGWVSYSLSVAKRRSNLDDREYYFDYDQRHIANLSLQYKLQHDVQKWYIPSLFNLQLRGETGRPYTEVLGAVKTATGWKQLKGDINALRDPFYFNANLRIEWHLKTKGRVSFTSFFDIWNVTNRKNILGRTYQYGTQYEKNILVNKYYTTPILPAGGVKIEF
jgi:hypothetical protein